MQHTPGLRLRWLLALLQVLLLMATLVTPAAAESPPPVSPSLIELLQQYGIVKGDETGNLNLTKPITRAEMITIMVRAQGKEIDAQAYRGWATFSDARGHWAEGYITYAAAAGLVKGDGNGRVRPDESITYAEALTLILRLVGKEPAGGDWPLNVLFKVVDLKLMPPGITAATVHEPAVRGLVFGSLAQALTTIRTPDGKTFLQANLDAVPPTISLARLPASTQEASLRVTGTVKDAASVTVNGKAATISGSQFVSDVQLEYGANRITAVATDLAGNTATAVASVDRLYPVSALDISGPAQVRVGGTAKYTVSAKDSAGNSLGLTDVSAVVEGNIGSFNLQTGILTAASTPGKGKITVRAGQVSRSLDVEVMGPDAKAARLNIAPVNDGRPVTYTKPMTVQVEVRDSSFQVLKTDFGRPVSLIASGITGLNVVPAVAYTEAGVATFTVTSPAMGTVALRASSAGLGDGFLNAEFGSSLRVRLSAEPGTLVIGSSSTVSRINATLVDEAGNPLANQTGSDLGIQLFANGSDGTLTDGYLTILRGQSSASASGDVGYFNAGGQVGSAFITGRVTVGQNLTVEPVSIGIRTPTISGTAQWDLLGDASFTPGTEGSFAIRLTDGTGALVPGNYAFQLSLSTSNNEPKTNGIPEGVTVTLGNTALNPVSDGIGEGSTGDGNDVIVRTAGGVATFKITYNKPGQVFVTVVPLDGTSTAYAADGTVGTAAGSTLVPSRTFPLTFAGTPAGIKLEADSDGFGNNHPAGATASSAGRAVTLRALLTDSSGHWIPGTTATVTLTRVSGNSTTPPGTLTATASDGKATFVVYATQTTGEDVYQVSATLGGTARTSNSVTIQVQNQAPAAPSILAVRGIRNGVPGALGYVAPNDTGLEVELARDASQHWVTVKVFTEGAGTPLYTSAPVDLSSVSPRVVVPKSALPAGVYRYQVVVRNGAGDSPPSLVSNQVTNAVYVSNIAITNARYLRSTRVLTLTGSGFTSTTDTVNPALLTIQDTSTGQSISLAGAQVTINNYSQISLNLTGLASVTTALENPANFSGSDVTLKAAEGWYTRTNGEQSQAINAGAPVSPMAHVDHVEYDRANNRLYLVGTGFNTVNLDLSKLKLQAAGADDLVLSAYGGTRLSDTQWLIHLNASAVSALDANGAYTLTGADAWAYDSGWTQPAFAGTAVYAQIPLSSATYDRTTHVLTLRGAGFTGGSVTMGNLQVTDLSTGQTVTLSGTPAIVSDSQVDFTLDNTAYTVLEDTTRFQGSDIYLVGTAGWFTNSLGRPAAAIPVRTLRLPDQ